MDLSIVGDHSRQALLTRVFFFIDVAAIEYREAHFTGIHHIAVIPVAAAMLSVRVRANK